MVRDRHVSTRSSCAIVAARSDHGRWSGVSSMSVLSSRQRMLSLWLPRLSTDRLAKSHEFTAPVVVYGKRGNVELIVALDEAAEKLGLAKGLPLAQARAMHPAITAIEEEPAADAKLLDQ